MHPFTSLTLWALATCTTLLLPAQTVLPVYSAAAFLCLLAIVSTSQLWMQYVPVQRFIRALFASRLPPGIAYLFAGPLLVVEQLKRQLTIVHEAQRAWRTAG